MANAELERLGFDTRIDRRSYAERGIERIPTVHLGPAAHQMERRGIRTERGDINRAIEIANKEIRMLRARIIKLDKWIAEEAANEKPPTLADVIDEILTRQGQSTLTRLHIGVDVFNFLYGNDIADLAELEQKVGAMRGKVYRLLEDMKPLKRRIETLDKHLTHSENFKNYRKIKARYEKLYAEYSAIKNDKGFIAERRAKKALAAANEYHEEHRAEIAMFDKADEYLRGVLQKRFDPKKLPIAKWQNERAEKTAERAALYGEYEKLKTETQKVEQIKRSVTDILRSDSPERTPQKSRGVAL
jgi:hypothetical protein